MKNGERRTIGNATIVCHVFRNSWTVRRFGDAIGPYRASRSWTNYTVVGADGQQVGDSIDNYKNAVKIAEAL